MRSGAHLDSIFNFPFLDFFRFFFRPSLVIFRSLQWIQGWQPILKVAPSDAPPYALFNLINHWFSNYLSSGFVENISQNDVPTALDSLPRFPTLFLYANPVRSPRTASSSASDELRSPLGVACHLLCFV